MTTLAEIQEQAKMPLKWGDISTDNTTFDCIGDIVFRWSDKISNYNPHDISYFLNVMFQWTGKYRNDLGTIITAPPGAGKSSALETFLHDYVRHDRNYSAIVVKERRDDVQALVDAINDGDMYNKYAIAIKGSGPDLDIEDYLAQFDNCQSYQVIVMTTAMLETQTARSEFERFTKYTPMLSPKKLVRNAIIIDEKPILTNHYKISLSTLNELTADVQAAALSRRYRRQPRYYKQLLEHVGSLRAILERGIPMDSNKVDAINPAYNLPRGLREDFIARHGYSKLDALHALEHVIRMGGIYDENQGYTSITVVQRRGYEWYQVPHVSILDGTGKEDPEYLINDFHIFAPTKKHSYSNVTFHICDELDFSRSYYNRHREQETIDNLFKVIGDEAKKIAALKDSPTLITTYKSEIERIKQEFNEGDNVRFKHLDSGRGSNNYTECDTAFYFGAIDIGPSSTVATAHAVLSDRIDRDLIADYGVNRSGQQFADDIIKEFRDLAMAVSLIQESNRLRAYRKEQPIDIYIFTRSRKLVTALTAAYPGCKVEPYYIRSKIEPVKAEDRLIEYFRDMKEGTSARNKDVYESLGITRRTMTRLSKEPRVIAAMEYYGIKRNGTKYEKGAI